MENKRDLRDYAGWVAVFFYLAFLIFVAAYEVCRADETPTLPDYTKEPYAFFASGTAQPMIHPERGQIPAKIYADRTNGDAVAIFEDTYAEWFHVYARDAKGNPKGTFFSFTWDESTKQFVFEKSQSFDWTSVP